MKNILLLGDSIRFGHPPKSPGYGVYVKEKLKGSANVYAPEVNCRFAQYTLRYLFDWAKQTNEAVGNENIDVIHWNNGLWDVLRLNGDEPITPCEIYVYMLKRVHNMLTKLYPNAKIIFALSTHVIEDKAWPNFYRLNSDIEEYNKAAKELMNSLGVEVNDLYEVTKNWGEENHSDWVHYDEKGSEKLAEIVIEKIKKYL